MKPLNRADRILVAKIRGFRAEGLTWGEVAEALGPDASTNIQQKFERLEYRELKTAARTSPTA